MEIRDYGLLGFHFMVPVNEKDEANSLFAGFKLNYITKNHSEEISVDAYKELLAKGNFEETITAYFGTEDDFSFSLTYSTNYVEVWFGFYPGNVISGYTKLLGQLSALAEYTVAGFEVEIGAAASEEGAESLSANFHPFCLLRNGELKWCGKGVSADMEALIEENLKAVELIK
jgi:hypothetical protein